MGDPLDVISFDDAKAALRIKPSDTTRNADLERVITEVSGHLDQLVGPIVQRDIAEERVDGGRGSTVVRVSSWPVTSWTSVEEYRQGASTATTLTEESPGTVPAEGFLAPQWRRDPSLYSGELKRRSGGLPWRWECGEQNIVVSYTAGRFTDTDSVEARYAEAAVLMLRNEWRAYQQGSTLVDEFDVPIETFPRFTVPTAVRQKLWDEWQGTEAIPGIA